MIFHHDKDFEDAIHKTAEHFKLREALIEKDYWVTYVLKNLSQSEFKDKVVFKGGTSLSKAYDCIDRFSEDIDLALLEVEKYTGAEAKAMLKKIERSIITGLEYLPKHPKEVKLGKNRTTIYNYNKVIKNADFGQVKDTIQLEINTFTNPVPHEQKSIQSYIGAYLTQSGFKEIVEQNELHPFNLNVLSRQRTFFEKMLSVIRLSYEGIEKLKEKIRHFYDLYMLYKSPDLEGELLTEKSFRIIDLALADDASQGIFSGDWIKKPLTSSPLLTNIEETWRQLESTYNEELSKLILKGKLPPSEEIISLLKKIKDFLESYDKKISTK